MPYVNEKEQPLCRFCGKGIRKRTFDVYFGGTMLNTSVTRGFPDKPRTRTEAQRFINDGTIVSVRIRRPSAWSINREAEKEEPYIRRVSVWDGKTYEDEYFCTVKCAQHYAYGLVGNPDNKFGYKAYRDARDARSQNK